MSNIYKAFEKKKAFIPFVTGGDPSLDVTEQLLYAMEEAGADLIEIGIPFSDPTAEGPVIQEANERALQAGCTTDRLFDMLKQEKGAFSNAKERLFYWFLAVIQSSVPSHRQQLPLLSRLARYMAWSARSMRRMEGRSSTPHRTIPTELAGARESSPRLLRKAPQISFAFLIASSLWPRCLRMTTNSSPP